MTCGLGVKTRLVTCRPGRYCPKDSQPETSTSCNENDCPKWNYGAWTRVMVHYNIKWYQQKLDEFLEPSYIHGREKLLKVLEKNYNQKTKYLAAAYQKLVYVKELL